MRAPIRHTLRRTIASAAMLSLVFGVATLPVAAADARSSATGARADRWNGLDRRATRSVSGVTPRVAMARATLSRSLGTMGIVQNDDATGSLRFVGRLDGFLTGPASGSPARVAMRFVRANRTAFGLTNADMLTLHLRGDYVDVQGTHHLSWVQQAGGLTVFGQGLRASVTADGRLVNVLGSPVRGLGTRPRVMSLDAGAAVSLARTSVGATSTSDPRDAARRVLFSAGAGADPAWETTTYISPSETDVSIVDDTTGHVVYRHNIVDADATGSAQAWAFYPSDLVPNGGDVAGPVTFPVYDGTALSGNNAHVFTDVRDDERPNPGDEIPAGSGLDWSNYLAPLDTTTTSQNCSADRACTWDLTVDKSWRANLAHNAVQVYHLINVYHDHLLAHPIGFTEAAGNFQQTNATGHGKGGDPVQGLASNGAAIGYYDNAYMTTPRDGRSPTMAMFLFRKFPRFGLPGVPTANGGDDAEVVFHEYTHGLSNRLVVYPDGNSGLDTYQSASMGEAWSDWYAEDFLNDEGYKPDTPAIGDVVMGQLTFGGELRSQPVDCPVGTNDPACPGGVHTGGPGGYTYGDLGRISPFHLDPHADGEIWLETLWDLRDALGSHRAERLVTRAMELSPASPSFLDMRNAILQADQVVSGGAHQSEIWDVFANRGMGYFATSESGDDLHPHGDFSLPADCTMVACGSVHGTVTDAETGSPLAGMTVQLVGGISPHGGALSAVTNGSGHYTIVDVQYHQYAGFEVEGPGYEPVSRDGFLVDGIELRNATLHRDWASISGGATLVRSTPPDLTRYGCGPSGAFDGSLQSGWIGIAEPVGPHGHRHLAPPRATIELPTPVDVDAVAVASGGGPCGAPASYGLTRFSMQMKSRAHGHWVTAITGKIRADGSLHVLGLHRVVHGVRFVRFAMLGNRRHSPDRVVLEVSVRGSGT